MGEISLFLEGHLKHINQLVSMDLDGLISSSSDKTIRIWKINVFFYEISDI